MAATSIPTITYRVPKRRHPVMAFIVHQPLGALGLLVIIVMCLAAAFANLVAPYDPLTLDYVNLLAPPSWSHPLGTDSFGRDILSRVLYGARISLLVGVASQGIAFALGVLL
ncbi:MAG: ABC transporter permease, partial [Burkholderiales bacterium]|nr:ABC transporter permease [Burkholderiales bacterium]